jgi:hypothetical protein
MSLTLRLPSLAVTRTRSSPVSPDAGVPVNVRVLAFKLNQLGCVAKGVPPLSTAVKL